MGARGGIGQAMFAQLSADTRFGHTLALSRTSTPPLNLLDEASIARAAAHVASLALPLRLVMVATGFLHAAGFSPRKRCVNSTPSTCAPRSPSTSSARPC